MYFPKPYEDEILGSAIGRAARHLGLPAKVVVREILQRPTGQISFFLPSDLKAIGRVTRLDPEQLALQHTVFPYTTAFMAEGERRRLLALTVGGGASTSASQLVSSVTRPVRRMRFCTECVVEDIAAHGESYWRRAHLLPATYLCHTHRLPLLELVSGTTADSRKCINAVPGEGATSSRASWLLSRSLSETLAGVSVERLDAQNYFDADWAALYRHRAQALGFQHSRGLLASAAFNDCFKRQFGSALLRELGCPLPTNVETAWPALMLRQGIREPFAPVKHVLMAAFFSIAPSRATDFAYERPGKKRHNMQAIDAQLAQVVQLKWTEALQQRQRMTVGEVLGSTRALGVFRHNRTDLPLTLLALERFRQSGQSARQVGRRPRFTAT